MDLRQLRYFVAVAEELHFRRAAERLCVSQPPVTSAIQAIEAELGVLLFERNQRKVRLTDSGRLILDKARSILSEAEDLKGIAKRAALGQVGTIRIGMPLSAPVLEPLIRAITQYRLRHPDVLFESHRIFSAEHAQAALLDHSLDVCVFRPHPFISSSPGLDQFALQPDRMMIVLSSEHVLAKQARIPIMSLSGERLITLAGPSHSAVGFAVARILAQAGVVTPSPQQIAEPTGILSLVAANLGWAILPLSLKSIRLDHIVWREIDVNDEVSQVSLAFGYRHEAEASRLVGPFVELVSKFRGAGLKAEGGESNPS